MSETLIDVGLYGAYALIVIGFIIAVVFGIMHLMRDPKQALWSLVGVVVVGIIFGIGYSLSSADFTFTGMERFEISQTGVKLVGAGLITFYLLAGVTILAAVVAEVTNFFR